MSIQYFQNMQDIDFCSSGDYNEGNNTSQLKKKKKKKINIHVPHFVYTKQHCKALNIRLETMMYNKQHHFSAIHQPPAQGFEVIINILLC